MPQALLDAGRAFLHVWCQVSPTRAFLTARTYIVYVPLLYGYEHRIPRLKNLYECGTLSKFLKHNTQRQETRVITNVF